MSDSGGSSDSGESSDDHLPQRQTKRIRLHGPDEQLTVRPKSAVRSLRSAGRTRPASSTALQNKGVRLNSSSAQVPSMASGQCLPDSTSSLQPISGSALNCGSISDTTSRVRLGKSLKGFIQIKKRLSDARKYSKVKRTSGLSRKLLTFRAVKRKIVITSKLPAAVGDNNTISSRAVKRKAVITSNPVAVGNTKTLTSRPVQLRGSPRLDEDGLEIVAPTLYSLSRFNRYKKPLNVCFVYIFFISFLSLSHTICVQSSGEVSFCSLSFEWLDKDRFGLVQNTDRLVKWCGLVCILLLHSYYFLF